MSKIALTEQELNSYEVGEAITLTAVLAILATAVVVVLVYKIFTSSSGDVEIPGGWTFQWS